MLVAWIEVPEIDQNGLVTIYEVLYIPLETFGVLGEKNSINTTELSVSLEGLQEFNDYNVSVRAFTSVGPGPYSDGITERTFEDGMSVVELILQ